MEAAMSEYYQEGYEEGYSAGRAAIEGSSLSLDDAVKSAMDGISSALAFVFTAGMSRPWPQHEAEKKKGFKAGYRDGIRDAKNELRREQRQKHK
jgi:hypothetical protein